MKLLKVTDATKITTQYINIDKIRTLRKDNNYGTIISFGAAGKYKDIKELNNERTTKSCDC